jgi:hypothetical protein
MAGVRMMSDDAAAAAASLPPQEEEEADITVFVFGLTAVVATLL